MELADLRDLIGKPYAEGGRGPAAYDCWGLVAECGRRSGRELPLYPTRAEAEGNRETVFAAMESPRWLRLSEPMPGAVALFRVAGEFHVGFVLEREMFIHVIRGQSVVVQRLSHMSWETRLVGFWRYE